ncbi:MAG: Hsp20/alpha crystallin family protein [Thermoguttaceae bacterium]
MVSTRWRPFGFGLETPWFELDRIQNEMNRVFDRFGFDESSRQVTPTYPAINLWEDADNLYVEAELPGMELSDLEIYVTGDDQLSLKGKRGAPAGEQNTWHRQERGYGSFARLLTLPHQVDAERVQAAMKHGVLCITLPKQEAAKPRRIEVKAD